MLSSDTEKETTSGFEHVDEQLRAMVDEYIEEFYGGKTEPKERFGISEYVNDIVTGGFVSWVEQGHLHMEDNEEFELAEDE